MWRNAKIFWLDGRGLAVLALVVAVAISEVHSQSPDGPVGGLAPLLPVVPRVAPRPAEGPLPEQKWPAPQDRAPVASFLDSLRGPDAAIEVVLGEGRLLTLKKELAAGKGTAVISVGDPSIVDFEVLPRPRMIRLLGLRAGVTDFSATLADGETYAFQVHVVYDLPLLRAQLLQVFPDAHLRLGQIREHIVVEGQARNNAEVTRIMDTIRAYLASIQAGSRAAGQAAAPSGAPPGPPPEAAPGDGDGQPRATVNVEFGQRPATRVSIPPAQVINLLRVPGGQQVMLKVKIAELNRTALREVGADLLQVDPRTGNILGTRISGSTINALGSLGIGGVTGAADGAPGTATTAFGIFPSGDWECLLRVLRRNSLLTILAEPNLVALSGHRANFLAGGEFPIPVPQGGSGGFSNTTIQFREFGVRLDFLPYIVDQDRVRLTVTPEVSSIDFTVGTTLVPGGSPVPGLNTRRTATTVELQQGQTLAIAGLLQVELSGETSRIPGLGDLPYLGPLFSNTTHRKLEKELLVMVTPYLVEPLEPQQVGPHPGAHITSPKDVELYFMNRIEGRTGKLHRPTTQYELLGRARQVQFERAYLHGPVGFSSGPK